MKKEINVFIQNLVTENKASQNTILAYQRDLLKFALYCDEHNIKSMDDITKNVCEEYADFLENQNSAKSTISRNIASLKKFMKFANASEWISSNPMENISSPKVIRKDIVVLSEMEVTRLLEQPQGNQPKVIRDRAMLELLYATGIKVSELIHLKLEQLDMQKNMIVCKDRFKTREIPFGRKASEALKEYLYGARDELVKDEEMQYVFCNFQGGSMSRQGFWKLIKMYAKKAGIKCDINSYTLRHSFAYHLLHRGADLKSVQEMLGHLDVYSTRRYVDKQKNHLRDIYQKAHPRG